MAGQEKLVADVLLPLQAVLVKGAVRFVVADNFKADMTTEAIVRLNRPRFGNFEKHFLDRVEEQVSDGALRRHRLIKNELVETILAALGSGAETHLVYLWGLLQQQPHGEEGPLLTSGHANIFFVRDAQGLLWAVVVYRRGYYWDLAAFAYGQDGGIQRCYAGDQFFSR